MTARVICCICFTAGFGTFETFRDVRSPVANGGKADNICVRRETGKE